MWEIDTTWIEEWLDNLDEPTYDLVLVVLHMLGEQGPGLGRPLVDTVSGSRFPNMKELRPPAKGRATVRILFAFDPARQAILLVAGDKTFNWKKWYKKNIPIADERFAEHLRKVQGRQGKEREK